LLLLDLSDCQLASWETQIQPFGGLPKLESLVLNNNFIETINITTATNVDQVAFSSLASMQLAGNPISTWTALDGINAIPRLRSLRLRNTPLTESMGVGEKSDLQLLHDFQTWNISMLRQYLRENVLKLNVVT
jgi:tubulin-specific chaperone E